MNRTTRHTKSGRTVPKLVVVATIAALAAAAAFIYDPQALLRETLGTGRPDPVFSSVCSGHGPYGARHDPDPGSGNGVRSGEGFCPGVPILDSRRRSGFCRGTSPGA